MHAESWLRTEKSALPRYPTLNGIMQNALGALIILEQDVSILTPSKHKALKILNQNFALIIYMNLLLLSDRQTDRLCTEGVLVRRTLRVVLRRNQSWQKKEEDTFLIYLPAQCLGPGFDLTECDRPFLLFQLWLNKACTSPTTWNCSSCQEALPDLVLWCGDGLYTASVITYYCLLRSWWVT